MIEPALYTFSPYVNCVGLTPCIFRSCFQWPFCNSGDFQLTTNRIRARQENLVKLGIDKSQAWQWANSRLATGE